MSRLPPTLDMTPDGQFRSLPRSGPTLSLRIIVTAVLISAVAGAVAVAAFALWVISLMLPVLVVAGAVAWGTLKYRQWQLGRASRGGLRPWP